jgi:hypothetical protein
MQKSYVLGFPAPSRVGVDFKCQDGRGALSRLRFTFLFRRLLSVHSHRKSVQASRVYQIELTDMVCGGMSHSVSVKHATGEYMCFLLSTSAQIRAVQAANDLIGAFQWGETTAPLPLPIASIVPRSMDTNGRSFLISLLSQLCSSFVGRFRRGVYDRHTDIRGEIMKTETINGGILTSGKLRMLR